MATTTNYAWNLPTVGGSEDTWGTANNSNWSALDTLLGGTNATEFAILDGATVTTAELNLLDGVTATTAELNLLDGVTATTAEINYVDGVTSNIQTQLDAKANSSGATLTSATITSPTITSPTITSPDIDLGSDATGDILYRNSGGSIARLGIGSTGQVLKVASGLPSWADASDAEDFSGYSWGSQSTMADLTAYQNTSGGTVAVLFEFTGGDSGYLRGISLQASSNGSTWTTVSSVSLSYLNSVTPALLVPNGYYYRVDKHSTITAKRSIFS